ncbi:hypothetical protein, partial [Streptomyces clavifer]|uniref:hypothetical protein n=1 Tax=Streptomyces clavifer TaxID=68188 RepID=UPI002381285C
MRKKMVRSVLQEGARWWLEEEEEARTMKKRRKGKNPSSLVIAEKGKREMRGDGFLIKESGV